MRKQWRRNRGRLRAGRRRGAGLPDDREPVRRPRRDLDVRRPLRASSARSAARRRRAGTPRPDAREPPAARQRPDPRPSGSATSPRSPSRAAAINAEVERARRAGRPRRQHLLRGGARRSTTATAELLRRLRSDARRELGPPRPSRLLRELGRADRGRSPPRPTATTVRGREITGANYRESLSHQQIPKIAPPRFDGWGDRLRFLLKENLPGAFPYTGGVFPFRREGEDPTRMFAGEGAPGAHQPPLPLPLRGPAGGAALDRVRLRHALRRGPRRAPRHLRQGRQLRRLDRHRRRRQEALLGLRPLRADDLGLDDDQRPGADHPRLLPERRDRPAGREAPAGERPAGRRPSASSTRSSPTASRARATRASCRPGNDGLGLGLLGVSGDRGRRRRDLRADQGRRRCARSAAPCRPTSSRRTRRRTPASSRPSSR